MTYRWVDHTAEVELELEGSSEEEVFADALAGCAELTSGDGEAVEVEIALEGSDRADLLARWVDELVYLADSRGFVPERVVDIAVDGNGLRATVAGREGSASTMVKAATYHDASFAFDGERWRARIVLDV